MRKYGGGARFESTSAPETIGRDRFLLVESQSLTDRFEEGETSIKHDTEQ